MSMQQTQIVVLGIVVMLVIVWLILYLTNDSSGPVIITTCTANSDCSAGQACKDGSCVVKSAECNTNSDCVLTIQNIGCYKTTQSPETPARGWFRPLDANGNKIYPSKTQIRTIDDLAHWFATAPFNTPTNWTNLFVLTTLNSSATMPVWMNLVDPRTVTAPDPTTGFVVSPTSKCNNMWPSVADFTKGVSGVNDGYALVPEPGATDFAVGCRLDTTIRGCLDATSYTCYHIQYIAK